MTDIATSSLSIYLLAGMQAEFTIPVDTSNNKGAFPYKNAYMVNGKEKALQNGFYVENEDVGIISKVLTDKLGVIYTHKKAEKNNIWFIAADGISRVQFSIISVPIHDHSTIVQGGPAYGTYFTDSEED